ncbi:RskA family anti-sigma factor [Nocardia sp. CA-128927]|uniref:RskA family anti-sigma factor n=1 Tax=Nocardia sp. CA-128927 TaxID=3239975 RepID=UPI003D963EA9
MNEVWTDLAHAVALAAIGGDNGSALQDVLDAEDAPLRAQFQAEIQRTREVFAVLSIATATPPPMRVRASVLSAVHDDVSHAEVPKGSR